MHRIDGSGHQDNRFTKGNPQTGTEATVVTADWLNSVQEEVAHVIEGQNLALDKDDNEQLKTAVNTAIGQAVANCKTEVAQDRASEIDAAKNEISGLIDQKVDAGIGAVKQRHVIRFFVKGLVQAGDNIVNIQSGINGRIVEAGAMVRGGGTSLNIEIRSSGTTLLQSEIGTNTTGGYIKRDTDLNVICAWNTYFMVDVHSVNSGNPYNFMGYLIVEEN